jgi:hypothetical protein
MFFPADLKETATGKNAGDCSEREKLNFLHFCAAL